MYYVDVVIAASVLATAIGLGWLAYQANQERQRAARIDTADERPPISDLVATLQALNADTVAAARQGAASLEAAAVAVQKGVRG